jgi:hypothetical protein
MAKAVEHFFVHLLAFCTFSFENYLFTSFAHFFIGLLIPWEFSVFELPINSDY